MLSYLRCIKSHRGSNDPECRNLSKSYLSCRMDRYVPHDPFVIRSAPSGFNRHGLLSSKGKEYLVIPTCQSALNQVLGILGVEADDLQGSHAALLIPCWLSRLKRLACRIGIVPATSAHCPPEPPGTAYLPSKHTTSPLPSVTPPRQHLNEEEHCPKERLS
jgi:hypothetical protein